MKTISRGILILLLVAVCSVSQTRSGEKKCPADSDRERLISAWRFAAAVLWLCRARSTFVICHALAVDGGYTVR
ncbi:MAG TPA: hypothetical protein VIY49_19350 [Bryobacteraceae bacterium]